MPQTDAMQELPVYRGMKWIDAALPEQVEAWPKFSSRLLVDAAGDDYDIAREELREYAASKPWIWPDRTIFFLCDVHADADAFLASLVASGGVEKTGPADTDFILTKDGREGLFVIGGDCLDKGPNNLRLLRCLRHLVETDAQVRILAGNHDVRALVGLHYMGRREAHLAHLFVRMGKKSISLFKEVWEEYLEGQPRRPRLLSDDEVRARYFPDDSWYRDFPAAVAGQIQPSKVDKEVDRIREKVAEMQARCEAEGLSLGMVVAAADKCKRLFCHPSGEFSWFFRDMQLAERAGSFLFLHAGVDDSVAELVRLAGVEGLNQRFRLLLDADLFGLYHGAIGNAFRTKYRPSDFPLTPEGVRSLQQAGLYAIVHGHRSITRGQRMVMRNGILNFECDASVDRNTRSITGLQGAGGAVTIFRPNGTVMGLSTDYPHAKLLAANGVIDVTTIVKSEPWVLSPGQATLN